MSVRNVILLLAALSFCMAPALDAAPAPPAGSLAAALSTARPPENGVAIAVGAEDVRLPNGAAPIAPGLPVGTIADAYGRLIRQFGMVQAVAPPTMVVLNTHPGTPNIYDDMPPSDVLRLLATSLNDGQWQKLTGKEGLGIADLDEKQQSMFKALFPGGSLTVFSFPPSEGRTAFSSVPRAAPPKPEIVTGEQLLQSRLRLSQQAEMMLPVVGTNRHTDYMGAPIPPPAGAAAEQLGSMPNPRDTRNTFDGVPFRAEVPNAPKPSDLDYNAPLFRAPISLKGLKTVGDLVARISHQTRTELYADARLESLFLTFVGADRAAPADLLPALAFCVTGTFRVIGPAFVLTDDRLGIGTRGMILGELFDSGSEQRRELMGPSDALAKVHPIADLPLRSDSLTITREELKQAPTDRRLMNSGVTIYLNFEQLTPEQQRIAHAMFDHFQAQAQADEKNQATVQDSDLERHVSLDGSIMLYTEPSLQLQVPGLEGMVDIGDAANVDDLFTSPPLPRQRPGSAAPAQAPPLFDLLKGYERRAVMVRPRTLRDLDSVIAAMPAADMNELWLVVPGLGESVAADKNAPPPPGAGALVAEALTKTKPAKIRVLPVLDLFSWGYAAPADALDYTLLGETSAQRQKRLALELERSHRAPTTHPVLRQAVVSPFAPVVATPLLSLLKSVIRPGVSGIVWRETSIPGYAPSGRPAREPAPSVEKADFGYTTEGRLRFLRQAHVDPIDLGPDSYYVLGVSSMTAMDLSLPFYNDAERTQSLLSAWQKLRTDTALNLLQRLYATAQQTAAANIPAGVPFAGLPIIVSAGEFTSQYGSWDNPRQFPPRRTSARGGTLADMAAAARKGSRITFYQVAAPDMDDPSQLSDELARQPAAGSVGARWDGVVFDFSRVEARNGRPAQSSLELLHHLITILHSQHPAP